MGGAEPAGRILVVDDDRVTAAFASRALTSLGQFEVEHTPDPRVALEWARSQAWDLVVTDVEMPGMSGIELLEALRAACPELPVVVMTAYATVDYAVGALRGHADEFLQKPFPPEKLVGTATAVIDRARAARLARHHKVLAIGAHPDDVEIGAAGTLLAHQDRGDSVSVLTLCRGAVGGSQDTRAAESQRAAEFLSATLYLEGLEDTRISEGNPTIGVIERVLTEVRPTVVYTHSQHDVHQDHRNTYRAAMVAARDVGNIYCFQSPSATIDFRPTRFVPIDGQIDRKLAAIGAFISQVEIRGYLDTELIRSTARYWSRYGAGRYTEAFEVVRDTAALPDDTPAADPALAALHERAGAHGR